MKIRTNLVSNSSSSSFIIATRNEVTDAELKNVVLGAMNVPADSPLYEFAKDVASRLANTRDEYTVTELLEDWGDESTMKFARYWPLIAKAINRGFTHFYRGSASSQSDNPAELALVEIGLEYEGDNIVIEKEAGY